MSVIRGLDYCLMKLFSACPIRTDTVVLTSTPDFADNTYAFYQYLIETKFNETHKIVWLVKNPEEYEAVPNVRFVRSNSKGIMWKRDWHLATAAAVVFTHSAPIRRWRKGQVFVHTTHSASQLKDAVIPKSQANRIVVPDYKLRCGVDGVVRAQKIWPMSKERMPMIGMPRLDLLFRHKDCLSHLIPKYAETKPTVFMAMETFRKSSKLNDSSNVDDVYGLNVIGSREEYQMLNTCLKEQNSYLIVKPHPLQDLSCLEECDSSNILFITDADLKAHKIQLYELLENCDALLTDYSSVFYDYLFKNRPIGFMIRDLNEYTRGFIIEDPLSEMPGPKLYDAKMLMQFISDVKAGKDEYQEARSQLLDRVFEHKDDQNSQRLLEFLYEHTKLTR